MKTFTKHLLTIGTPLRWVGTPRALIIHLSWLCKIFLIRGWYMLIFLIFTKLKKTEIYIYIYTYVCVKTRRKYLASGAKFILKYKLVLNLQTDNTSGSPWFVTSAWSPLEIGKKTVHDSSHFRALHWSEMEWDHCTEISYFRSALSSRHFPRRRIITGSNYIIILLDIIFWYLILSMQ